MTTVHDLIPDVLANIFSYLKVEEIVENVCHVCTYWNNVVQESDDIWSQLVFDPPCDESTIWIKSILEAAPKLKHIKLLRYGERVEDIINFMIKHCPEVRSLHYNQPDDTTITISLLQNILNSLKSLTTIGLYKLSTPHKDAIVKTLSECNRLETVAISECTDRSQPMNFKNIAEACVAMINFSYISHNKSNHEYDVKYLLKCKMHKLVSLHIRGYVVCNELLPFIERCTELRTLNLEERSSSVSQKLNLNTLKEMKHLRLCGVSFKQLPGSTYESLVRVTLKLLSHPNLELLWDTCPNLQHVSIIGCDQLNDGDESFKNISRCEDLRTVVIHNNCELSTQTIRYVLKLPKLTKFVTDLVTHVADEDEETISGFINCIRLKELVVFGILPSGMILKTLKFKVTYINSFVSSLIMSQNKACNDDYVV